MSSGAAPRGGPHDPEEKLPMPSTTQGPYSTVVPALSSSPSSSAAPPAQPGSYQQPAQQGFVLPFPEPSATPMHLGPGGHAIEGEEAMMDENTGGTTADGMRSYAARAPAGYESHGLSSPDPHLPPPPPYEPSSSYPTGQSIPLQTGPFAHANPNQNASSAAPTVTLSSSSPPASTAPHLRGAGAATASTSPSSTTPISTLKPPSPAPAAAEARRRGRRRRKKWIIIICLCVLLFVVALVVGIAVGVLRGKFGHHHDDDDDDRDRGQPPPADWDADGELEWPPDRKGDVWREEEEEEERGIVWGDEVRRAVKMRDGRRVAKGELGRRGWRNVDGLSVSVEG